MGRLTTNKPVSEMNMVELAHNCCYADKDMNARYRDFENDISARDFAKTLLLGSGYDDFSYKDEPFDMEMHENLFFDPFTDDRGMIALIYRNLWAMADLRERLKYYEDLEEQVLKSTGIDLASMVGEFMHYYNLKKENRLLELPCKVGDVFWELNAVCDIPYIYPRTTQTVSHCVYVHERLGKLCFLTKEEAEKALAEMEK